MAGLIICLCLSHMAVGFICWQAARRVWYRRGLDDAWMDYAGTAFPQ